MKPKLKYFSLFVIIFSLGFFFYKHKKNVSFVEIPLCNLKYSDLCYLHLQIENQKIPVVLDTGFIAPFTFSKNFLDKIKNKKKDKNSIQIRDINGNEYKEPSYFIDHINIANCIKINATVIEENLDFLKYGSKISNPNIATVNINKALSQSVIERLEKKTGRMGNMVLKSHNYWSLDFPNSKIYYIVIWEDFLKKFKISLEEFVEIPLIEKTAHTMIPLETDFGIKNFVLDTAAWRTVMKCPSEKFSEHQIVTSKNFAANNYNLGQQKIYLFNFPEESNFDGVLGMDFLKNRTILLDFKNNRLFISKEKKYKRSYSFLDAIYPFLMAPQKDCVEQDVYFVLFFPFVDPSKL